MKQISDWVAVYLQKKKKHLGPTHCPCMQDK